MTVQADEHVAAQNTPDDAVYAWMAQQPSTVANSLAIRQVSELDSTHAAVLVSFRPEGWVASSPALALFDVAQEGEAWVSKGFAQGAVATGPFSLNMHAGAAGGSWVAVFGEVLDPKVHHLTIRWSDGLEQGVDARNSSYLSIRTDDPTVRALAVVGLDAAGNTVGEVAAAP